MGIAEKAAFKQAEREKTPLPDKIMNAPEVLLGLELYINGFNALTSCRSAAYGSEGPIPWTAMRDYCVEYNIRGEQREYFYDLLAQMDKTYLDYKSKKLKSMQS